MMKAFVKLMMLVLIVFLSACGDYKDVELRQLRNVTADVSNDPMLKMEAVFFNPNQQQGKLKAINIDVFVEGKKAAVIKQTLKIKVPSQGNFTVPIQVKLNLKEQGLFGTLMGMIGAKRMKVHYKGNIRINYHGLPIIVPVDHEEEIRIRF